MLTLQLLVAAKGHIHAEIHVNDDFTMSKRLQVLFELSFLPLVRMHMHGIILQLAQEHWQLFLESGDSLLQPSKSTSSSKRQHQASNSQMARHL
jgi:hypothetical protein